MRKVIHSSHGVEIEEKSDEYELQISFEDNSDHPKIITLIIQKILISFFSFLTERFSKNYCDSKKQLIEPTALISNHHFLLGKISSQVLILNIKYGQIFPCIGPEEFMLMRKYSGRY